MDWRNRLPMIQNKIKTQLHARKMDDLDAVAKLVQEFDIDQNGVLDKVEFSKLLSKAGIYLTTQELTCVYAAFDINQDGFINYNEFIQIIRSDLTEKRAAIVKHAFQFLDNKAQGKVKLDDLFKNYRPENHPRVRTREKTAEQVFTEFTKAIIKKSSDGVHITQAEFQDYYADVNATLPAEKEEYFVDLVTKSWGITTSFNYVSPERIADLEAILYEKIRQKTFTKEDEAKTVKKAFKYFDLDDSGLIDLEKFTRALEKFGCVFSKYENLALFKKYDLDASGKLNYDEFCNMFAVIGSGTNPNVNPVFELEKQPPKEIILLTRNDCRKKGLYGVRNLSQILRKTDKFNSGGVDRNNFVWAIKEAGTSLTKHDVDKLYKFFDKKADNFVRYPEFLALVRGDLTHRRADLIKATWTKLSADQTGTVKFEALQNAFDPYGQPDVRVGKAKPEQAFKEFISQWRDVSKEISYTEFFDFYWDISAAIDSDDAFEALIKNSWRFSQRPQSASSPQKVQPQLQSPPQQRPQTQALGGRPQVLSPTLKQQQQDTSDPNQKTMKNLSVRFADNVNFK